MRAELVALFLSGRPDPTFARFGRFTAVSDACPPQAEHRYQ